MSDTSGMDPIEGTINRLLREAYTSGYLDKKRKNFQKLVIDAVNNPNKKIKGMNIEGELAIAAVDLIAWTAAISRIEWGVAKSLLALLHEHLSEKSWNTMNNKLKQLKLKDVIPPKERNEGMKP